MKKAKIKKILFFSSLLFLATSGFTQPCAGTPAGSNSQSSLATVCDGEMFSLTLDNVYTETGYAYQWQSSPDGISYTDISGAINDNFSTSQSADTYYQCIITCTNSSLSATSTPIQVVMNAFTTCYCISSFPVDVEPITLVDFAGINNASSDVVNGSSAQEDYIAMIGTGNQGYTYPITLKGNTNGNFTNFLTVFIDFNHNGSYLDVGESFDIGTIDNSTGIDATLLTGNITIPISALTGVTGMRVTKSNISFAGACNASGSGQTEDYLINISSCVPPVSVLLSADDPDGIICPGATVIFNADAGYAYYDFQVNASSVQSGTSDTYSSATLGNGDNVTVIAGYDVSCATTSNTINITYHSVPSGSIIVTDITCSGDNDGSLDLTVSGGNSPFTFLWSNTEITEDILALPPGGYSVIITDVNFCSSIANATVNEPTVVTSNLIVANISCFGLSDGAIDQTISGGTGGYTIDWDNDGTGDFDDTEDLLALTVGTYNVVVMDANGCVANNSINITEPTQLSVSLVATNVTCNGYNDGSINATISGGTLTYTIDWDNDGTGDNDDTEDLINLSGGNYNILVIDANNCTASSGVSVFEPAALNTSITSNDVLCNGGSTGSFDLTVNGGTGPIIFDWDNDGTGDFDDTEDMIGLMAGNYNVSVADSLGCIATDGITINEPAALFTSSVPTDVSCFGDSDGLIDLTIGGGVGGYTFDWNNDGTGDFDDLEDLSSLTGGTYYLVVLDANNCMITDSVIIVEPNLINLTVVGNNITCFGLTDGSTDLTITGGTIPFSIDWNNDGTGDFDDAEDLSGLSAGNYLVNVVDLKGCSDTISVNIIEPTVFSASLISTDVTCSGLDNGIIDVTPVGGTEPYVIDWDNDGTGDNDDSLDLVNIPGGNYTISMTDANGCLTFDSTVIIFGPAAIGLSSTTTEAICSNVGNGSIDLTITGGTGAYTILWSNNATTEDLNPVSAGPYSVVVLDINGCSASLSDTVYYTNLSPTVSLTITPDIICNTDTAYVLSGGMPAGGNFNGTGVINNVLNPGTAGVGSFIIIYTYTDTSGCFNTAVDQIQIDNCLGVEEMENENTFLIYPNPSYGKFTIETGIISGKVTVLNNIGQTIYSDIFNTNKIAIDLSQNERGFYFVVIDNEGETLVKKIIKE